MNTEPDTNRCPPVPGAAASQRSPRALPRIKASLLGALVVAGIAVATWQQIRLHRMQAENAQLRAQETELRAQEPELAALRGQVERLRKVETDQAELERLRQWQAQTQPELLRLRGRAGAARQASTAAEPLRAPLTRQPGEAGTHSVAGAMADALKQAMEQDAEGRLSRLTANLRLTREQTEAARDILMRQAQANQQVYAGNTNMEELAKLGETAAYAEQQIQALLTPDQKAAYQDYQQEEAARNARQAASAELLQMVSPLNLTSAQEDRAYAALYELTLNQLTGRTTPAPVSPADQMQSYLDQKAKALESVLTPAQMEQYRRQQAAQAKLAKEIVGKVEAAGAAK